MAANLPELPPSTTSITKLTRGTSCLQCQKRKVGCDRQRPSCSRCLKGRVDCSFPSNNGIAQRRKRIIRPDNGVHSRLKRCEERLRKLGMEIDEEEDASNLVPAFERHAVSNEPNLEPMTPNSISGILDGKLIVDQGHSRYIENNLYIVVSDELADTTLGSSEDEKVGDKKFSAHGSGLLFGISSSHPLYFRHPDPIQIFKLWQVCLDNVNPLVKLFHAPTVQQKIIEASSHLADIPANTEALLFSIYLSSINSLNDAKCKILMGESREVSMDRYAKATQQALNNCQFMQCSDIVVLQAYTMFLLSMRQQYDPHTLWILTGTAIRIGQRLGLHREDAAKTLSIFDAEMRRRLWWQIMILDHRAAQLSGTARDEAVASAPTRPLNINDSDLNPNMKEPPNEHTGITEMLFCSIRYEFGEYCRKASWVFPGVRSPNTQITMAEKDAAINEIENTLHQKYLRFCDYSVPLHMIAVGMATAAISYVRLMAHHPRHYPDRGVSLPQSEKDMLFTLCLRMMVYDHMGHAEELIQGYLWHLDVYFQLDAFIYMLSALKYRTGEESNKAWQQVENVYSNHPKILQDTRNVLYFAIGNLAVKAWDKREADYASTGIHLAAPSYIQKLRMQRKRRQPAKSNTNTQDSNLLATRADISTSNDTASGNFDAKVVSNSGEILDFNLNDDDLLPSYMPQDINAMDWEYWQTLLADCDLPMLGGGVL